jgi:ABC-type dipeptide/oligopeptide/nickel transport system permease component
MARFENIMSDKQNVMETPASIIETLFEKAEAYSKTSFELGKLKSVETTSSVVTYLVSRLSVVIMISLFALILNIGIAIWLGKLLGEYYYGFFIVAGFYCVAGIVFSSFSSPVD